MSASVSTPRPPTTERVVALNRGPWVARPGRTDRSCRAQTTRRCSTCARSTTTPPGTSRARSACPSTADRSGRRRASCSCPTSGSSCTRASEAEALDAAQKLWAVGIFEIAGYVARAGCARDTPDARRRRVGGCSNRAGLQIVDVRETTERDSGYIPGSTQHPVPAPPQAGCGALDRRSRSSPSARAARGPRSPRPCCNAKAST